MRLAEYLLIGLSLAWQHFDAIREIPIQASANDPIRRKPATDPLPN